MININLLPQDYRRRERTSFKVFGTIMAAVIAVCCSLGYFGHVYLNKFKTVEAKRIQQQDILDSLTPLAAYDDALVSEKAEYTRRSKTIMDIATSRVLWTKFLDQFIDIVNNNGDTARHLAWFKNMNAKSGGGRFGGPSVSLNAMLASDQWSRQANFLDDIRAHQDFVQDIPYDGITSPGGRVVKTAGKTPPKAIEFRLDLQMRASKDWVVNKKK